LFRNCRWRRTQEYRREVLSESRMREICLSGSMSGERKRSVAEWPKLPRLSSTLPKSRRAPLYRPEPALCDGDADPAAVIVRFLDGEGASGSYPNGSRRP